MSTFIRSKKKERPSFTGASGYGKKDIVEKNKEDKTPPPNCSLKERLASRFKDKED